MASILLSLFLISLHLWLCSAQCSPPNYTRNDFPSDFAFGAGTSAYQVEGAAAEDGRSPSIWDTHTHAGKMADKSTGDIASDQYHKYKEDVKLMSDLGLEVYKFSISWSRLIPNGRGEINPKGLEYYNNLINELLGKGIQPHVTLYHLDLPQALEDEYNGWLSPRIMDDFTAYADVCFREFGDRVSHWTTMAEVNIMSLGSYDNGDFPPSRCSYPFGVTNCTAGNSSTEPYIATHNALLTHASIFHLYKTKYQFSWHFRILDPLVFGDYPKTMKKIVGSRLPVFTKSQSEYLKGSFDFIGLNHYTSLFVVDNSAEALAMPIRDYNADMLATLIVWKNETPSDKYIPSSTPYRPYGLRKLLEYFKQKYKNPPIYIQENGCGLGMEDTMNDTYRIDYLNGYIGSTLEAIRNGVNVRGYFMWSLMDVFEYLSGYQSRFGLYFVDFDDKELKRIPKLSAHWYSNFLKVKNIKKMQGVHSVALDLESK
ncbi:beta-glucosidase 22-like isoform X2 [Dioscorea cayenensis subsp. rotundata]|uniref:Beta-glucosidase 22-like isoform X2 n=1 Tax=Dioscorea cayennensis subsp. rotundata TaxID=55577 RepID=A0AB40AWN0_DIOCR|nr:beta-glucosidase 22-like isoform X2 [Dioscorea cayenensis subsp. rotundata]